MLVIVLRSFADSIHGSHARGAVIELPDGVNWLEAGLVEPAGNDPIETAMIEAGQPKRTARTKRAKK